jgi:PAS domain S-box-containing protein
MKVLVVDDNSLNRKLLRTILAAEGHSVVEAEDGYAALDVLQRDHVDAVMSDILMPRMDGYRLCYEIRKNERLRTIPFIACTATYDSPKDKKLALDFGADKFLWKLEAPEVIVKALNEAVERTRGRHAQQLKEPQELLAMREYSETLVRKLEERNLELAEANKTLEERARLAEFISDINVALTHKGTLSEILQLCVEAMVGHLDAAFARIWTYNPKADFLELKASAGLYTHIDGGHACVPVGQYKIGLIASERQPHLTNSVIGDSRVHDQGWAKREGMVAFAGYPLIIEDQLVGVMAMFARKPLTPSTLQAMESVSKAIATAILLKWTDEEKQRNVEGIRAILESALDCIVTMDHEGKILEFNPAAEKTFGYNRAAVIGKEMSELIIPPPLRERHRRGLAHYLSTGEGPVLGKRIEINAMRADGTEFPIELSITRIAGSQPPLFTGFIRDVTERKKAEAALQARYQELLTLHETSQTILISPDLKTTLEKVLDKAVSSGSFDLGIIRLFDPSTQSIQPIVHQGYRDLENVQRHHQRSIAATTGRFSTSVLTDRQPRIEENVAQCEGLRTFKSEGVQSALVIPVMTEKEIMGVLQLGTRTSRKFHPNEVGLAETIGNQIGMAVQKARLYEETQDNLERIRALHEIDRAISSTLDLNATLVILQKTIPKFVPSIIASTVRLMDKESGKLDPTSCWNLNEDEWRAHVKTGRMTLAEKVFESQRPLTILNVEKDSAHPADFARKHGLTSYLGVPLSAKEKRLGVLGLYTKEQHEFTNQEIEFLNTLAGQAAIAIHNARLFEETKNQSIELERSNKVKDEFLSVMSHELRTPLNVIMGYTGLLKEAMLGEINPEQMDATSKIMGQCMDLLVMVNSILQATQLGSADTKVFRSECSLSDLLDELKSSYAIPQAKELTISWDYPAMLPTVKTDEEKLKHILQNLINNAVKFTEKGQVVISARVIDGGMQEGENRKQVAESSEPLPAVDDQQGAWLEFQVADTGVGIPQEQLPVIFDMFRQVDSSETRPYGGTGLGLYIVKKYLELLGGKVEVESELGKGSTFTVVIPCEAEIDSFQPTEEPVARPGR